MMLMCSYQDVYKRQVFEELYDKETADQIRILYGGSVNASNAAELFAQPDICLLYTSVLRQLSSHRRQLLLWLLVLLMPV